MSERASEPVSPAAPGARSPAPVSRRLRSAHPRADDSPGLLLWQVTNRWQAAQRAALKPHGLTHVQFVLLASLAWLDTSIDDAIGGREPVTQQTLAEHAMADPMMTSQVLRALDARGLISRGPHPSDGRALALRITTAGAALANAANADVEACDLRFFAALGAAEAEFAGHLRALRR